MARPSVEQLFEDFEYKEGEGAVYWRKVGSGRKLGKPVGHLDGSAIRVKYKRSRYPLHRVIWAMHYGEWPPKEMMIDHIDRDITNNHHTNLRLATNQQNQRNTSAKNYSKCKQTGKWRVSLMIDGRHKHLGRFDSEELAELVATEARETYFGEFAREVA